MESPDVSLLWRQRGRLRLRKSCQSWHRDRQDRVGARRRAETLGSRSSQKSKAVDDTVQSEVGIKGAISATTTNQGSGLSLQTQPDPFSLFLPKAHIYGSIVRSLNNRNLV